MYVRLIDAAINDTCQSDIFYASLGCGPWPWLTGWVVHLVAYKSVVKISERHIRRVRYLALGRSDV